MRRVLPRARDATAPQRIRAITYEAYLARNQAERRAGSTMDALLADLFDFCQLIDRAVMRALAALASAGKR